MTNTIEQELEELKLSILNSLEPVMVYFDSAYKYDMYYTGAYKDKYFLLCCHDYRYSFKSKEEARILLSRTDKCIITLRTRA